MYIYIYLYKFLYLYIFISVFTYKYIRMYINTYLYIFIYFYIYLLKDLTNKLMRQRKAGPRTSLCGRMVGLPGWAAGLSAGLEC